MSNITDIEHSLGGDITVEYSDKSVTTGKGLFLDGDIIKSLDNTKIFNTSNYISKDPTTGLITDPAQRNAIAVSVARVMVTDARFAGGAKGDGSDDTPAIVAALAYLDSIGGGELVWPMPSVAYCIGRVTPGIQEGPTFSSSIRHVGQGLVKIKLIGNCGFFFAQSQFGAASTISANTAITDTTFSVADGTIFSPGQDVMVRIGQAAYDAYEPDHWFFAKVVSATSSSVTLDTPAGYALNAASVTNADNKKIQIVTKLCRSVTIENFELVDDRTGSASAEYGIRTLGVKNVIVNNVRGYNPGAGLVYGQFCENIVVDGFAIDKSVKQGGQASKGRGFNFAECVNVSVSNGSAVAFDGAFYVGEGGNRNVKFKNILLNNNSATRDTANEALFGLLGDRSFECDGLYIIGNKSPLVNTGGTTVKPNGEWFKNLVMAQTTCDITDTVLVDNMTRFGGNVQLGATTLGPRRTVKVKVDLMASQASRYITIPAGQYIRARILLTSKTGITSLYIGNSNNQNQQLTLASITAGTWYDIRSQFAIGIGRDYNLNKVAGKRLIYSSDATVPNNAVLWLEVEYFADTTATSTNESDSYVEVAQKIARVEATTTLGAQTGRMQVYDANGSSVGYVPVYAGS